MSLFGRMARFAFFPILKVGEQARTSRENIRRLMAEERERRRKVLANIDVKDAQGLTPSERFERLYESNDWNEDDLARQLATVRVSKWFAAGSSALAFLLAVASLWFVPPWMMLLIGPGCVGVVSLGCARTIQMGLFQAQIEQRAIIRLSHYLARPDLFRHLFW